jgi:hypothetical protein
VSIIAHIANYQCGAQLRDRAQRCRIVARTYDDGRIRDQMFQIAAEYDRLADRMERDERTKRAFQRMAAILESIEVHRARARASCDEIRQTASVSREVIANSRELMALTAKRFHLDLW